jgi:hypothetical protein
MVKKLSRIVSVLPTALVVGADLWMYPTLKNQNSAAVWRIWIVTLGLGLGIVIPRLVVRLVCTLLLFGMVILTGFSVGMFYLPALLAGVVATLLQMEAKP